MRDRCPWIRRIGERALQAEGLTEEERESVAENTHSIPACFVRVMVPHVSKINALSDNWSEPDHRPAANQPEPVLFEVAQCYFWSQPWRRRECIVVHHFALILPSPSTSLSPCFPALLALRYPVSCFTLIPSLVTNVGRVGLLAHRKLLRALYFCICSRSSWRMLQIKG